jgi:hypothetical protein
LAALPNRALLQPEYRHTTDTSLRFKSLMDDASQKAPPKEVVLHRGPLTLTSLDVAIKGSIFRPKSKSGKAKKNTRGLHYLGWEFIPPERNYDFIFKDLNFVTAEGAVSLAALVDCLRNTCNCQVNVKVDSAHQAWVSALHLEQLTLSRWLQDFPDAPAQIGESLAFPLWRYLLGSREECKNTADRISRQVRALLENLNHELAIEVSMASRTVFKEGLLNVLEHAYALREKKVVFESITITPVADLSELRKRPYLTKEELTWFQEHDGRLMIEVAIADIGKNVPATLGKAYCNEHPSHCAESGGLRLGVSVDQILRAKLHHDIAQWAFDHKSTRKTPNQFENELAMLNWRGLHRALNTAAKFDGCLIMRSGQARAGFVFCRDKAHPLSASSVKQHDFPGTALVLRFPIIKSSVKRLRTASSAFSGSSLPVLVPDSIVSTGKLRSALVSLPPGQVQTIGLAHPFKRYGDEDIKELLNLIRQIPPNTVSVHFFASLESPVLNAHLAAFQPLVEEGPPRLTAFHRSGESLKWKFVGILPEFARPLIASLEETGIAQIPNDEATRRFARRLANLYEPFLRVNESSLELINFNSEIDDEVYERAMQGAFIDWSEKKSGEWIFGETHYVVRLPTGRLVEQYVSVLKALYSDDLFAQAMGWRFSSIIRSLKDEHPALCIVTESAASYFIARILLLEFDETIDIFIGPPPPGKWGNRPAIVFADAIHKGDTLSFLLQKCRNCVAAICAMDLRQEGKTTLGKYSTPITSLVRYVFDPKELVGGLSERDRLTLEVDAVTHIPHESPTTDTLQIGTNQERTVFIENNPTLFRFGLHRSGGRIHTFSLGTDQLIDSYQEQLCGWITSLIEDVIRKNKAIRSIVIFTRTEASIKRITQLLGSQLLNQFSSLAMFTAIIPVVPAGSKEVFGRPAPLMFHGLQPVGVADLFTPEPTDFLAVYLEDSCVTGKTLLNFLIQVSKAATGQTPVAVVAIPILSRFSPAEETFYGEVCQGLAAANRRYAIPFCFRPLFRLQIRSTDRVQALPVFEFISQLSAQQSALDLRLQKYVQLILQSLTAEVATSIRANLDQPPLQHPFFTGTKAEPIASSDRTIRIRHLVALFEQNMGVLSEVLFELLLACNEDDDCLLTMLALEPDLVKTPPFSRECRLDITNLAIRALESLKTHPATKSDALAVLACQGQPIVNRISQILPAISGVPELIDQYVVHLLSYLASSRISSIDLQRTIETCRPALRPEEYAYVRGCIKSHIDTSGPSSIHASEDALRVVRNLVARTAIHGNGHSSLKTVNNWLLRTSVDKYSSEVSYVRRMLGDAIATIRSAIMPGLSGLHWWAEHESYNLAAALAFRDAWFSVSINLNSLEAFVETLEEGPIGQYAADHIERLWLRIRDNSQINAPDIYLSGSIPPISESPPILEQWAPAFFSAPFEVAVNMATKLATSPLISSSWEVDGRGLYVVIAVVPLKAVNEVFRLLLEDMQKHGSIETFEMTFRLDRNNDRDCLVAQFQNEVAAHDERGTGKSQRRISTLATDHGFTVKLDPAKKPGQTYAVTVTFPEILNIKCE